MDYLFSIVREMGQSVIIQLVIILVSADIVFGILNSIKNKCVNSTVGINGLIRKAAIISTVIILYIIDVLININFISFIPKEISTYLNMPEIGLSELFGIILILFEALSIMKNLNNIGLPLPKKLKSTVEKFLNEMTDEESKETKE